MTYEELVEQIRSFPASPAKREHGSDAAAALSEVAVAADIARATQESLNMRVEIARARGATWTMLGDALGVSAWRAQQRYFEHRPFGARW